ncbi:hypothetical protein I316_04733 [Kwoniella heveanensis BCC8398]|uniref:BTB domain-containing protein n=1 Tax=Kwoniella heveanensis BCC8398 TaxID=1296120 RepID=A0A1B9GRF0_9TREE|nr:hypothetical protein I316_04733 [Kwoniella heveanensis BCC8398]
MSTSATDTEVEKNQDAHSNPDGLVAAPTINDINRPFQFDDSDITLISSDNLHFKIHSYHLMAASPVFRDMIAIGKGGTETQTVELADTTFETGSIVSLFLDICYGTPLPHYKVSLTRYLALVKFLNKYDCELAKGVVKGAIHAYMNNCVDGSKDLQPGSCFDIAVAMDDIGLMKTSIRRAGTWHFAPYTTSEPDNSVAKKRYRAAHCIPNRGVLDLTASTFDDWERIPNDVKFALLRATYGDKSQFDYKTAKWDEVADSFEIILNFIREKKA